jgi:hypothetical protein
MIVHLVSFGKPRCGKLPDVETQAFNYALNPIDQALPEGHRMVAWSQVEEVTCPECRVFYDAAAADVDALKAGKIARDHEGQPMCRCGHPLPRPIADAFPVAGLVSRLASGPGELPLRVLCGCSRVWYLDPDTWDGDGLDET